MRARIHGTRYMEGMTVVEDLEEAKQIAGFAPADSREASRERLVRMRHAMAGCDAEAFLVRDVSNISWLTAFDGVFDGEPAHALLIDSDSARLHTDSRYAAACRLAADSGLCLVDDEPVSHGRWAVSHLGDAASLGIESSVSLGEFRQLERALADGSCKCRVLETDGIGVGLRAVKDSGEAARMRAAQAITDAAFSHMVEFIAPGMTERDVKAELEDFMVRHGAEGLAFGSIIASGANGASPHAIPGSKLLEAGECVVMDFGARACGYCSDMTRTVFIGEPDARLRGAYDALRQANEQVEAMLAPGVTGAQAHQLAEDVLAAAGFAGKMGHGLGHGVGIDIHESPVLAPRNTRPLLPGNVVTVEPGIYIDGEFGMRLEDFGIVTERGFDVFTQSTHEMVIL